MRVAAVNPRVTPEEYLALEREAEAKTADSLVEN